ncbi:hypothetical protein LDENG_00254530 [Lucifuga dentata]|nr:hypothetical protein LDENG_00254530 [Lucifuga dentata]
MHIGKYDLCRPGSPSGVCWEKILPTADYLALKTADGGAALTRFQNLLSAFPASIKFGSDLVEQREENLNLGLMVEA